MLLKTTRSFDSEYISVEPVDKALGLCTTGHSLKWQQLSDSTFAPEQAIIRQMARKSPRFFREDQRFMLADAPLSWSPYESGTLVVYWLIISPNRNTALDFPLVEET